MSKYIQTFFKEKEIPATSFTITTSKNTHIVDSLVIIEFLKQCPREWEPRVEEILRNIDFHNGNILDFLQHMAKAYVEVIELHQ